MPENVMLYGHAASGHAYKVAIALHHLRIPYQPVFIDIFAPTSTRPKEFQERSPFQEVPLLVYDGLILAQSNAILMFLGKEKKQLYPVSHRDAALIDQWLFWEMSRLNMGVANLRYVRKYCRPGDAARAHEKLYQQRATDSLTRLDLHLQAHNFICHNQLSIADISLSSYLFWLNEAGLDIADWPHVERWLDRLRHISDWLAPEAFQRLFRG